MWFVGWRHNKDYVFMEATAAFLTIGFLLVLVATILIFLFIFLAKLKTRIIKIVIIALGFIAGNFSTCANNYLNLLIQETTVIIVFNNNPMIVLVLFLSVAAICLLISFAIWIGSWEKRYHLKDKFGPGPWIDIVACILTFIMAGLSIVLTPSTTATVN